MKQIKKQQGTMVLFFETDLEKATAITVESMTEVQKQVYHKLSEKERSKVLAGYGAIVTDLETDEKICEFNMENYHPPEHAIDSLAKQLLPLFLEYQAKQSNQS